MSFPDYGLAVERVGFWIAQGVPKMTPGQTLFLEPTLPPGPDRVQALFEFGGRWNVERGWQDWSLMLVTRAADLLNARETAIQTLQESTNRFRTSPISERGPILDLQIESLPALRPRDDRGRVILESRFLLRIHAVMDVGLEMNA